MDTFRTASYKMVYGLRVRYYHNGVNYFGSASSAKESDFLSKIFALEQTKRELVI